MKINSKNLGNADNLGKMDMSIERYQVLLITLSSLESKDFKFKEPRGSSGKWQSWRSSTSYFMAETFPTPKSKRSNPTIKHPPALTGGFQAQQSWTASVKRLDLQQREHYFCVTSKPQLPYNEYGLSCSMCPISFTVSPIQLGSRDCRTHSWLFFLGLHCDTNSRRVHLKQVGC